VVEARTPSVWSRRRMAEVQGLRLHHVAVPIGALEQPAVLYPNLLHISHAHLHVEGASARDGHAASDI